MNKKRIIIIVLGIATLTFFIYAMDGRTPSHNTDSNKMRITASFYPLAFLAEEIGGDKVLVNNLTPAGAEPHEFEPSPRDIALMEKSQILLVNGFGLEPWYKNTKENINPQKTVLVVAGENLDNSIMNDPHVWLSPRRMKLMAEKIEASFSKADPINENQYLFNLSILKNSFDELDKEYRDGLTNCTRREIVTSHTAFHYLAEDYGLTELPIAGLSPETEPSPKALVEIVNFAKQHELTYIFFESLVSPKLATALADELGAKTLVLNPLEGLTQEELVNGKNYLSVMRENLINLQTALSCIK